MEIKYNEIRYFKQIFEKLVKNVHRTGKYYFLDNASQIYYELRVSLAKIKGLLYSNPLTSKFLEQYETLYYCYSWILKKIDLVTSQFSIPSIPSLYKRIKTLVLQVKEIIPILFSSNYPINDTLYTDKIKTIISKF